MEILHGGSSYDTVFYKGEVKNDKPHGYGETKLWNETTYKGNFKDGMFDGYGEINYSNGNSYKGEFKDSFEDGKGTFTFKSGNVYIGDFKHGKFDGNGQITYSNGNSYKGGFTAGRYDGYGEINYSNGNSYKGEINNGIFEGKGIYSFSNNDFYKGSFKDGVYDSFGEFTIGLGTFYGYFEKGKPSGKNALFFYKNNDKYEGEFRDIYPNGKGKITSDKYVYEGEIENGLKNGKGTIIYSNGTRYSGVWDRDTLIPKNKKNSIELLTKLLRIPIDNPDSEDLYEYSTEFKKYYKNYDESNKYTYILLDELANVLDSYQKDCNPKGNLRRDIICQMILTYVPFPLLLGELEKNASILDNKSIIGKGVNGDVYSKTFQGTDIVIKAPSKEFIYKYSFFNNAILQETFFNFCILNKFIENGMTNFIPTYGFFLCDKPSDAKSLPICKIGSEYPWFYLIQQKVEGTTLELKIVDMDLPDVKKILCKVYEIMAELQDSPYKIAHNDLHLNNIMIHGDHIYILDWGEVSFTYKGYMYKGIQDIIYTPHHIVTGANDIYFILYSIYVICTKKDVKEWALSKFNKLFKGKFGEEFDEKYLYKNFYLFYSLSHIKKATKIMKLMYFI